MSRQSRSFTNLNAIEYGRRVGSTVVRRLVALSIVLVALAVIGAGCRHDGREMRPALASQDGTVSTTAPPTAPATEDDFFDDAADASGANTLAPLVPGLTVTAPWRDGSPIDARYTCKGANIAPALSWTDAPEGTQEIAVTMIDLDFTFDHWTMTGIAPDVHALAENTTPAGAVAALNGSGVAGYAGPCPPAGATHTYLITVHYLDRALQLAAGGPAADMRAEIDAATMATAEVTGTFTGS